MALELNFPLINHTVEDILNAFKNMKKNKIPLITI